MIEIIGYISAIIIGISLGLIGGGGSILTVPVLVYLLGITPVMATAYSLFIVGTSSMVGGLRYGRKGLVDIRTAIYFGVPSIIAVYLTRRFLVPALPEHIASIGDLVITKDTFLMTLFAALMLFAAIGMIWKRKDKVDTAQSEKRAGMFTPLVILLEGFVVGTLTGLVGAGGGFLIIPALVLFSGLKMRAAIGTSLIIISAKSLIGFLGDVSNYTIDWTFLIVFSLLAIVGIFSGISLGNKIDGNKLKTGFGWFILVMGIIILWKELL